MNDDELKKLWRLQEFVPPLQITDAELINRMKRKIKKFDRDISRRDWGELAACIFVFCGFSLAFFVRANPLARAGCVVIVLNCVFIAWKLISARRAHPPVPGTAPTSEFVRAEIAKVGRQIGLLQSVLWWYLLPLFIGLELFEFGFREGISSHLFSTLVNVAIFGIIYWLNIYAARKSLMPLKQQLEHILDPVANPSVPEAEWNPTAPKFNFRLGKRTVSFGIPENWPWSLTFCVVMNACWVAVLCSLLAPGSLTRDSFPSAGAQGAIFILACVVWVSAYCGYRQSERRRLEKFLLSCLAALTGLYALAWATNAVWLLLKLTL